ncbi:MAG: hypothetical protein HN413_06185 [Chloroflexi bacterium]|nr:hypothetical protein [Chloroflexota bacterium]
MQRKFLIILVLLVVASLMAACNSSEAVATEADPNQKVTFALETVYAQLTSTLQSMAAAATATATSTPVPPPTATPVPPTETPTNVFEGTLTAEAAEAAGEQPAPAENNAPANNATSSDKNCYHANLEYESVPDGTVFLQGQPFQKEWRLKNIGSCDWNGNFSLRWVDGEIMGAGSSIPFPDGTIPTWGYLNIVVDMKAPLEVGTYRGNWMIVSDDGKIFGIGPNAKGWFWVEIKVVAEK